MTQHAELIARLEAAEVVTHALEVEFALHLYEHHETFKGLVNYDPELWLERNGTPLTSLDAARALVERVLSGWAWSIDRWGAMSRVTLNECDAEGWHGKGHQRIEVAVEKPPEMAICIAILRALEAKA